MKDLIMPNELDSAKIFGRNIWLYEFETTIGNFYIVEYERKDQTIERYIFDNDIEKAKKKYKSICKRLVDGKI